jgi:hypothetical protein
MRIMGLMVRGRVYELYFIKKRPVAVGED